MDAVEIETIPFEAASEDGTVLRGHVHKPRGADNLATVLTLSPYWSAASYGSTQKLWPSDQEFVDAGFAFAAVSTRGSGASDGCLQFGGKLDQADAYAVIQTLADQPWSKGKVGMFGLSYDAWTQYMAIASGAPALKAAVPMSGLVDLWSFMTARGAPEATASLLFPYIRTPFSTASVETDARPHVECPEELSSDVPNTGGLVATGDRTGYFRERDLRPELRGSDVAVWVTSGVRSLGDVAHNRHHIDLWKYLDPERSRFMIGQWGHTYPAAGSFMNDALGWFDHYLRGGPQTVAPGVFEFQDDSGAWHSVDTWPPRPTQRPTLFLSAATLETSRTSVEESTTSFWSSPKDPGIGCGSGAQMDHHALFVSPPTKREATLAGTFRIQTQVTSSLPGGNFAAVLYKTTGDGSCLDLATNGNEVGRVQLDLRHWKTPGKSQDFPIDTPTALNLESEPIVSGLAKGERLVLAIGGGSSQLLPDPLQPLLTIQTGPRITGHIELPVVKGRLLFR